MIDRQGEAAAARGDLIATAGYAAARAGWTVFGSEEISRAAAGQTSSRLGVGFEILAAVPVVGVAARGTIVLGKFPEYIKLADDIGAKRFSIPTSVWNRMSASDQWAANQKFLDRAISRGDEVRLSNRVGNVQDVNGAFRQELDYLIANGYRLSSDGTRMIR